MSASAPEFRRILVTGNAGSGKTTVARLVGERLGIEVAGLDRVVWGPHWQPTPPEARDRLEDEIAARTEWVVDGVSLRIQERADLVVFLEVSRRIAFWRCLKRNWRYLFRSRPGLPENCPEWKIVPRLVKIIWNFPDRVRPRILALGQQCAERQQWLSIESEEQLRDFLDSLGGSP